MPVLPDFKSDVSILLKSMRDFNTMAGPCATKKSFAAGTKIYAEAYWTRLSVVPRQTTFERLANVFGNSFVDELLLRYFRQHTPLSPLLNSNLDAFPHFLREQGLDSAVVDLAELCLARWRVLTGPDPEPRPVAEFGAHQLFLQSNHALLVSEAPLWDLWHAGSDEVAREGEALKFVLRPQAVLLFKSSPLQLETISVPMALLPCVERLSRGVSLLDSLEVIEREPELEPLATPFLHHLAQAGGFCGIPV